MTDSSDSSAPALPKRLLLAGGGHAHLAVLEDWIRRPPTDWETWLISSDPVTAYSGMIPGWMAGHYKDNCHMIDLQPLAKRAGVRLVIDTLCGLDADRELVFLGSGKTLSFDLISMATGSEADTSKLALLGDRVLPVRPANGFVAAWPRVLDEAAGKPGFRLIVVGGGAAGVELALGADRALRRVSPRATVSIVTDVDGLVSGHSRAVRDKVAATLTHRGIDVHFGHAVGTPHGVLLADGSEIGADRVIAATGSKAPDWLKSSGLTLDEEGFIAVGADLRSVSHGSVFAAGDIATRIDRPMARSGVHAVKAGPVLAANLRAAMQTQAGHALPPSTFLPKRRSLSLLATGDRRAILSWGPIALSGGLVWRLKDRIDRGFVSRYAVLGQETA